MDSGRQDKCPCCGHREGPGQKVGAVGGAILIALVMLVMATPLIWLARVTLQWALGA